MKQNDKNLLWPHWPDFLKGQRRCKIIAYGTLINKHSIGKTIGHARVEGPVVALGLKRIFNFSLIDENYQEQGGRYERSAEHDHCATLNLVHTGNAQDKLNGIMFSIARDDIDALAQREYGYDIVPVEHDQMDATDLAYVFLARKESPITGDRVLDNIFPNESALRICLTGAATYGKAFLDTWIASCYLADGAPLMENLYYRNFVEDYLSRGRNPSSKFSASK